MPLGITRNHLDFEILETGNPMTLVFVDSSQYMEPPDRPLLEVTPPGYTKYMLANVVPNQVNTFNSNTLGFPNSFQINHLAILPDGVWKFRFKICPYNYVFIDKYIMRVTLINQRIDALYNKLRLEGCTDRTEAYILDELTKAQILIRGAKAIVNMDQKRATEYYRTASKIVEEIDRKFNKHCDQWGAQAAGKSLY